ncbi:hypothetical protein DVK44_10910 [Streptomyces paludis]|uniref:Uncharacterized protein n=1 Tax=Streptomyces paludis TaxID=2282738 RepID=A0A345HN58_9ACTN|nr:hypothetical protein DVK44_10910 [Streptomyces paludis]
MEETAALPAIAAEGPEAADGPVFVDESGRRSKKLRRAGWVVAIACACYAMTVVAALVGGDSNAPWLPIPGADKKKADTVKVRPEATESPTATADPVEPSAGTTATDPGTVVVPRPSGTAVVGTAGQAVPSSSIPAPQFSPSADMSAQPSTDPVPGPDESVPPGSGGGVPTTSAPVVEPDASPVEPSTSEEPAPGVDGDQAMAVKGAR